MAADAAAILVQRRALLHNRQPDFANVERKNLWYKVCCCIKEGMKIITAVD